MESELGTETSDSSTLSGKSVSGKQHDLSESPLRLNILFDAVVSRNPELLSARQKWDAARKNAIVRARMPDPKALLKFADKAIQTRNGPIDWKVNLTQTFPWFGKLEAREKAALAEAGKAAAKYRKTKWNVRKKMAAAYFDYVLHIRSIEKTEEMIELVRRLEQNISTRYESGQVPRQDLLKTQIELSDLQRRSSDYRDLRKEAASRINGLLNRSDQAALGEPSPESREGTLPEKTALLRKAFDNRPKISEVRFNLLKHRHNLHHAELDFYPDITAGFKHYEVGNTNLPGAVDPGRNGLEFIFGFTLPLWQKPRRARVQKNRMLGRSAQLRLQDVENRTEVKIAGHIASIRNDRRNIDYLENTAIPKAKEALESSETAYQNGEIDVLDLLDSEKSLLRFELDRYRAISSYRIGLVKLEQTVGTSISLK